MEPSSCYSDDEQATTNQTTTTTTTTTRSNQTTTTTNNQVAQIQHATDIQPTTQSHHTRTVAARSAQFSAVAAATSSSGGSSRVVQQGAKHLAQHDTESTSPSVSCEELAASASICASPQHMAKFTSQTVKMAKCMSPNSAHRLHDPLTFHALTDLSYDPKPASQKRVKWCSMGSMATTLRDNVSPN